MVQMPFDATNVEPNAGGIGTVPSGRYAVQIVGSDMKATKRNDGYMLVFTFVILQPAEFAGRRLLARLNIQNPNPQAVEIAYGELSAISRVCGVLRWNDTQELHGRPFQIDVVEKQREDDPTKKSNDIVGYLDMNGQPPGKGAVGGGQHPQQPQAPQQPPQGAQWNGGQQAPQQAYQPPQQAAPWQQQAPQANPPQAAPGNGATPPWHQGQTSAPAPQGAPQYPQAPAPAPAPAPGAAAAPAAAPAPTPAPAPAPAQPGGSVPPWLQGGQQ